ncbi:GDYXXLXY family protein [Collimonas arenae]|uniref:GDYXXLXY family protein n=1 Tax=Collimonas arenae TaxID=279058 RepID=A0A127PRJ3_9BURK|nr:GDYXXLXY domain-containing protein [Collimonas arenae]AMP00421.1 GDYXXLXY family protein [Collimonas arenae]AMP10300.1 GDYXXLXY family protein [Collimonas arenae]
MKRWHLPAFVIAAVATLLLLNGIVWQHEQTLKHGRAVLLQLRPVDPRSLMQGDYMALDYQLTQQVGQLLSTTNATAGEGQALAVMLRADADGVAQLQRIAKAGEQAQSDEILLRLKWENSGARLPSQSYFFAEGEGARFAKARYAIFRVANDGTALLSGLADEQHLPIADRIDKSGVSQAGARGS